MKKFACAAILLTVVASLAAVLMTGCDEAEGMETIVISPSSSEMTTRDNTVWLTASFPGSTKEDGDTTNDTSTLEYGEPVDADDVLHLPLEWEVSNPSLGDIFGSGGTSALYVRSPNTGVNTITVRDQYNNEGYATIRQMVEQYRLELTAVSGSTSNNLNTAYIPVGEVTATLQVSSAIGGDGPTAPFTWTTLFPTRGYILAGQGTDTVVFRTTSEDMTGFNVVQCTDAYGVTGTIVVRMGEAEDDDGGGDSEGGVTLNLNLDSNRDPDGDGKHEIPTGESTITVFVDGSTYDAPLDWDEPVGVVLDSGQGTDTVILRTVPPYDDDGYLVEVSDASDRKGYLRFYQKD